MRPRRIVVVVAVSFTFAVLLGAMPVWSTAPFIRIALSEPGAPLDELTEAISHLDSAVQRIALALTSVDARGRIYVLGRKKHSVKVVVFNLHGRVQETVELDFASDGNCRCGQLQPDAYGDFSVSSEGHRFWTACRTHQPGCARRGWYLYHHDRTGRLKMAWRSPVTEGRIWRVFAEGENSAYVTSPGEQGYELFRVKTGQLTSEQLMIPLRYHISFLRGSFWSVEPVQRLPSYFRIPPGSIGKIGIVSWKAPADALLATRFTPARGPVGSLYWIDNDGNYYIYVYKDTWAVVSPRGKIIDTLDLSRIIGASGIDIQPGRLIKADETGVFFEIMRGNQREYAIVRATK